MMATEQRTTPEQRAALRRRYRREMTVWRALIGEYGDGDVLAAVDDADALAGARAEIGRLRTALATIQQWDCLNPPNTGLCEDFPWLRELVDTALTPGTGGASDALA